MARTKSSMAGSGAPRGWLTTIEKTTDLPPAVVR